MKPLLILLWIIAAVSSGCAQQQEKLLMEAYRSNSREKLKTFFDNWAGEIPVLPDTDIQRLDETMRNTCLIFRDFYTPLNLDRTGGSEWGSNLYYGVKYVLVQPRIDIGFVDTLNEKVQPQAKHYEKITHFRPALNFTTPQPVILTSSYADLLNKFLGNTHSSLGSKSIMTPALAEGETKKRQEFLQHYIRIFYGHWGGYWQLNTYPVISRITFDRTFDNALVDYVMVYEGGSAYYKRVNGAWTLVKAGRTWIE